MRRNFALAPLAILFLATAVGAGEKEEGFVSLFDGKSFKGWKAAENKKTWSIEEGAFVCHGDRSHLFYMGADKPFVNFEFKADVMTTPGSNAGIYFHTRYQESDWPRQGFEAQVNNTYKRDPKRTGSLYGVVDVLAPPAKDNEWFTMHIKVQGRRVTISVNDKKLVDYVEPKNAPAAGGKLQRRIGSGTFALQGHDPGSKVYFKNLRVKRLD